MKLKGLDCAQLCPQVELIARSGHERGRVFVPLDFRCGRLELQPLGKEKPMQRKLSTRRRVFGKTLPFQCATKEAKMHASGQTSRVAEIVISSPANWWHCTHLPLGVLLTNNTLLRA